MLKRPGTFALGWLPSGAGGSGGGTGPGGVPATAWWDVQDFTTLNGGLGSEPGNSTVITDVADKAGSYDWAQGGSTQDYWQTDINSLHPGIRLIGTGEWFEADALASLVTGTDQSWSMSWVAHLFTDGGYHWAFGRSASSTPIIGARYNNARTITIHRTADDGTTADQTTTGTIAISAAHYVTVVYDGAAGTISIWLDGVLDVNAAAISSVGAQTLDSFVVGGLVSGAGIAGTENESMGEMVFYSGVWSTAEVGDLHTALVTKWGF